MIQDTARVEKDVTEETRIFSPRIARAGIKQGEEQRDAKTRGEHGNSIDVQLGVDDTSISRELRLFEERQAGGNELPILASFEDVHP